VTLTNPITQIGGRNQSLIQPQSGTHWYRLSISLAQ
jgi:hypothetical protein